MNEQEELLNSVSTRKIRNDYRTIDTIVGTSYTSFIAYVTYEDLDNGTITIRQLKDNSKVISEKAITVPMNEFKVMLSKGNN